ncbi:MAG: T9SS type A sorting domain-containing protein [Candidatus Krumholzibacteria bacterium]|nr:T9SS type A sorting domain-containing protein [Candidatus Krumholzibacteria bacterium]MDH4336966.1 T9SS type A sorting domain-containing protein [Candidatus Krumholzibacteria bacterium]
MLGAWTFESGPSCTAQGWVSVDLTGGFGDFATLGPGLAILQQDPCAKDLLCAWSFTAGSADNFACGGFPVQPAIPLGNPATGYIWNEIQSPVVALAGTGSHIGLEFAVYREMDLDGLVFYTWRVRSFTGSIPGPWRGSTQLFYAPIATNDGGSDWFIQRESIGAFVDPGADSVQIALGVVDMAGAWGGVLGSGLCHSHTPLFDGVKLYRVDTNGPLWFVDPADLFQDAFAEDGTLTGTVRVDMARDINPRDVATIRTGDSLVVSVNEPTVGLDNHVHGDPSSGPAVYLHVRDVSATKSGAVISGDVARWPLVSTGGGWTVLRFDSVRTTSGTNAGGFCVDLDDALYVPGEQIDFYFSARDALGRTTYWSEFSESDPISYPMEMTCLPVYGLLQRSILYVDDADGFGAQSYFETAFQATGIADEVDRYDVRAPDELVGNGPGSRVRNIATQLTGPYDSIIWSSGNLGHGLIGDGSGAPEKSPDAQMLVEYLAHKVPWGFVYLNGDNLPLELDRLQSTAIQELRQYIGYRLVTGNHRPQMGISPLAKSDAGSSFTTDSSFIIYGGCPLVNQFDVMEPAGTARSEITYGAPTGSNSAVVSQFTQDSWVVLAGFGLEFMRDDDNNGHMDRADFLHDMLVSREWQLCGSSSVTFSVIEAGIHMKWSMAGCPDQLGLRVQRRYLPTGQFETIFESGIPPYNSAYTDDEPVNGDLVHYRVVEVLTQARESLVDSVTVFLTANVSGMVAHAEEASIDVSWALDDLSNLSGLTLQRRPGGTGVFAPASVDSVMSPGTTSFRDIDVEPGRAYDYRLLLLYGARSGVGPVVSARAPTTPALSQNAPNPFNPTTTIRFLAPAAGHVSIVIYDASGAHVRTLADESVDAGVTALEWDGRNDRGAPCTSGVYFYRMAGFGTTITRKMVLVK